jgi:hypothetical protein
MNQLVRTVKGLVPASVRRAVKTARKGEGPEAALGAFVLAQAADYARSTGGDASALANATLGTFLHDRAAIKMAGEAQQYVMTAFQPDYERNLYPFYKQQEYMILLAFLSYPFRGPGSLNAQLQTYSAAADALPEMDILDYGAGMPFGLIQLLRTRPEKVKSVTLVDLDLIHTRLSEHIIRGFIGDRLTMIRKTDPEAIPSFGRKKFNFCFGKDIFEHLTDPAPHLENILKATAKQAVCYFDFTDHGEKYLQHVTPLLSPLNAVVEAHGFEKAEMLAGMSGFTR